VYCIIVIYPPVRVKAIIIFVETDPADNVRHDGYYDTKATGECIATMGDNVQFVTFLKLFALPFIPQQRDFTLFFV